jgi:parvulin-like peptidyl-prolyl isomerase
MTRSEATKGSGRKLRLRLLSMAAALATVSLALVIRQAWQMPSAQAQFPLKRLAANSKSKTAQKPADEEGAPQGEAAPQGVVPPQQLAVMAVVNGEKIERTEVAREALRHFGEDVLESIINKRLIAAQCKRRNIGVTQQEVKEEMDRMAQRFGMPTDQLLAMLQEERHITPEQYSKEIIWPTVALRKLAGDRLKVTEKDFKEAFDMLYGEAIQARLIACATAKEAEKLRAQALANPDEFGNLAKVHSIDTVSASAKGMIQPIHHHQGDPNIEKVAFALAKDEISEVIEVGDQFVILKCEARLRPQQVERKKVEKVLIESIRDKKLRLEADTIFKELQDAAQIENVMNDPAKSKKHPGVAAIVNGETITLRQVAEECIERHGIEMLDGLISRHLLQQALKKKKIQVTEADMEAEIERAAVTMGKTTKDDKPDVKAWLKDVVENQKMSLELYRDDVVWPSVGLRKLAGEDVEVTDEDLKKSFEANYGPRVRCRAIVLANQRDAQKVWDSARKNPTLEHFAELAKHYTIEPGGKVNEGEIPPIQRHHGEPSIEKEAFSLKKEEISSIIQVGDKWVILFCEGYTKPVNIKFKDVEQYMRDDIRDKKMRLAMSEQYTKLQDEARIDNFLTGTMQSGSKARRQNQNDLMTVPEGTLLAPDSPEANSKGASNSSRPARPKTAAGPSAGVR